MTPEEHQRRDEVADYLDRVNRTVVSADILREALKMHESMPEDDKAVFEARVIGLCELLDRKDLEEDDRAGLLVAIEFRLRALAHLCRDGVLRGWSIPGVESDPHFIHADVVQAAAAEPLIENAGEMAFDPAAFRRRMVANAKKRGQVTSPVPLVAGRPGAKTEPIPSDSKELERWTFQKIGEFIASFSIVEDGLRRALAELLNLHPALIPAVTASYDFAKLCEVTREASNVLRSDRMDEINDLISRCYKINETRVKIAHGTWNPLYGVAHMPRGDKKHGLRLKDYFTDPRELAQAVEDCSKLANEAAFFPGGDLEQFEGAPQGEHD